MFDVNRVSFVVGVAIATALALAGCGGGTEPNVAGPDRNGHYTGEMILIPAGSLLMGNNGSEPRSDPNELPQHSVSLSAYSIGKY
jgi:formylglycine-generating enzyme required for sulfatase activity